jgi:hypothetical protein
MVNAIISGHKDTLVMQCMKSITDVFFLAISLLSYIMPISCFRIAMMLYPRHLCAKLQHYNKPLNFTISSK